MKRKWGWIGHTLRKPYSSITRQALRKRAGPRNTWRRDLEADTRKTGHTWRELEKIAQDRGCWRGVIDGLCSWGSDGPNESK